jgi:catechol 2,3-dioxygenase-like lactoylglutathione lyase family enzyme
MINGIEHLGIFSNDTEALKNWYIEMCGFEQVYENGKGTYFLKADDGSMIEFVNATQDGGVMGDKTSGLRHIALSVDDFDSVCDTLMAANVEVVSEPMIDDEKGIKTFFFRDIDGNVLHLIYRRDKF